MRNHIQTQVKQNTSSKVPASIVLGRVLLVVGSILFLIDAVLSFCLWVSFFVADFVDLNAKFGVEFFAPLVWNDPVKAFENGFKPILYVLVFLSGIGGISYVWNKKPFVNFVSWASVVSMVVWVVRIVGNLITLFQNRFVWNGTAIDFFSLQIDALLFSIGWLLAKNWLD